MATDLTPDQMKRFVRDHFEEFVNGRNAAVIHKNMTPDFYDHDGPGGNPSHATGVAVMVEPASRAALEFGSHGLIIEVATNGLGARKPLCDAAQAIDPPTLKRIVDFIDSRNHSKATQAPAGRSLAAIQSRNPEAVVLWTGSAVANQLVHTLRQGSRALPLFLSQKAAGAGAELGEGSGLWTVSRSGASVATGARFAVRFEALTGQVPTPEAEASYDAVCLIASALQRAGPNRARLRDQLSKVSGWTGISGQVSFDGAGNNLAPVAIVPLQ